MQQQCATPVQAAECVALAARAAAETAAAQLQGAEAQARSSRRRTHDAEASAAARGEALEEATFQIHQLQASLLIGLHLTGN